MCRSIMRRRSVPSITTGRFQQESHIAAAVQGDRTILTNGTRYFTLNEVGTRIWGLLEQPHSLAEIVQVIGAEYDGPVETIQDDTEHLLRELARLKLIAAVVKP